MGNCSPNKSPSLPGRSNFISCNICGEKTHYTQYCPNNEDMFSDHVPKSVGQKKKEGRRRASNSHIFWEEQKIDQLYFSEEDGDEAKDNRPRRRPDKPHKKSPKWGKKCGVPECQENHSKHYCKYCKDTNSNHFSSRCQRSPFDNFQKKEKKMRDNPHYFLSNKNQVKCKAQLCQEEHRRHYCRICEDQDSNHLARNCRFGLLLYHVASKAQAEVYLKKGSIESSNGPFGEGVYFFRDRMMAKRICQERSVKGRKVILECKVSTKRIMKIAQEEVHGIKRWKGRENYNSIQIVRTKVGESFEFEDWVVFDCKKVCIMEIIEDNLSNNEWEKNWQQKPTPKPEEDNFTMKNPYLDYQQEEDSF